MSIKPQEIVTLNNQLSTPRSVETGPLEIVRLASKIEQFQSVPEYETKLPKIICDVVGELADEYDHAFSSKLMPGHVEAETDYQHTLTDDNRYSSLFYQIDMAGLPQNFLDDAANGVFTREVLKQILSYRIFEFEDSIAMYSLLRGIHSRLDRSGVPTELSGFASEFDQVIADTVRRRQIGSIVVGAVTMEKYVALLAMELGVDPGDARRRDRGFIKAATGFDGYVDPDTLRHSIEDNLLYARTSAPIEAQKNPKLYDSSGIAVLADDRIRAGLRAAALTLNIDSPHGGTNINDTKAAMPFVSPFSVAVTAENFGDLQPDEIAERFGMDQTGKVRVKPMEAYGAYRHQTASLKGVLTHGSRLHSQVNEFGPYILQPEVPGANIVTEHGSFGFIDRVFVAKDHSDKFRVIGGFRNLLPTDNDQAKKNTFHGNGGAVWGSLTPEIPRSTYQQGAS